MAKSNTDDEQGDEMAQAKVDEAAKEVEQARDEFDKTNDAQKAETKKRVAALRARRKTETREALRSPRETQRDARDHYRKTVREMRGYGRDVRDPLGLVDEVEKETNGKANEA